MERFKNFWYHYKFRTIFFAILTVIIAVGIYSCATKEEYDMQILFYTSKNLPSSVSHSMEQTIEDIFLKNGKELNVCVRDFSYDPYSKDGEGKTNNIAALSVEMKNKSSFIFISDKFRFEEISNNKKQQGMFLKDKAVFDKYNNTAFSMSNTKFENDLIKKIEENGTTIAKMPEYYISVINCDDKNNEEYKKALELIKMIKTEG